MLHLNVNSLHFCKHFTMQLDIARKYQASEPIKSTRRLRKNKAWQFHPVAPKEATSLPGAEETWRIRQSVTGHFRMWQRTGTMVWWRATRYLKQSLGFWDLEHSIKSRSAGTGWMEMTALVNYCMQFNKGTREKYKREGSVFSLMACQEFSCGFALHAKS